MPENRLDELQTATFQQLLEAPIDPLMVVDEHASIQMLNAQLEHMFGYRREELLGKPMDILLPERFRQRHEHHMRQYFKAPKARAMGTGFELLARRKDGVEFPVEISLTPLVTGETHLVSAAIRDISKHQQVEQALREHQQRIALHLENTPLAVIEWDLGSTMITAWNRAAERMFGYSLQDIKTQPMDILFPPDKYPADLVKPSTSEAKRQTLANQNRDGEQMICEWYITPLTDAGARMISMAALVLDVTTRQKALEKLFTAQEEERARISRDLHDQVGQSLTAILLGINAVSAQGSSERIEYLKTLTSQAIEDVRRLSRALRPALLDELGLEVALKRFARELAVQSDIDVDVLVRLSANPDHSAEIVIYRVVQEALTNVVRHAKAQHVSVIITAADERMQITIEDNGIGFEPENLDGTRNLGLVGMRERLELLGGSLHIESSPGRGTAISARIPL